MTNGFAPIAITTTPADVVRRWIGEATRAGYGVDLVQRMAEGIDSTTDDVHAIARGSSTHLTQLLDGEIVQRLAGSVGASPLALSYRTVLRYDLENMGDMLEDDDKERAGMDDDDEKRPSYRCSTWNTDPDPGRELPAVAHGCCVAQRARFAYRLRRLPPRCRHRPRLATGRGHTLRDARLCVRPPAADGGQRYPDAHESARRSCPRDRGATRARRAVGARPDRRASVVGTRRR